MGTRQNKGVAGVESRTSRSLGVVIGGSFNPSSLLEALDLAKSKIAPLWDTRDYVAVNPLFGYRTLRFLDGVKAIQAVTGVMLLPDKKFFKAKYEAGEIEDRDLTTSLMLFQKEVRSRFLNDMDHEKLVEFILSDTQPLIRKPKIKCLSDVYDEEQNQEITEWLTCEVSKWASAFFDEGQALWKMPGKQERLFKAWKSLVVYDSKTLERLPRLKDLVKGLSGDPEKALIQLCKQLEGRVSPDDFPMSDYFSRLLASVSGWTSFIGKNEFEDGLSGRSEIQSIKGGIVDILVIRLAYDLALMDRNLNLSEWGHWQYEENDSSFDYSFLWLQAYEAAKRREISEKLLLRNPKPEQQQRPLAQMAFCIDVRSEVIRRHLERQNKKIQTIGFAGFFGLPIAVKKWGFQGADPQCPVLIKPAIEVAECLDSETDSLLQSRQEAVHNQHSRKSVQASTTSSFSLAETFGFGYALKMMTASLGLGKPNLEIDRLGASKKKISQIHLQHESIDSETRQSMALSALTNMGLTKNFARYVFFFGHGGESANNPYEGALDCGACAGHNGQSNAKLLASLLNSPEIREFLKHKGIEIPDDTQFFSGWHNTTRDQLIVDDQVWKDGRDQESLQLTRIFDSATEACRKERAQFLPTATSLSDSALKEEMKTRAMNWSEIRPEWGLARNHSFIVARRSLTREVPLEGRSFLHDYNAAEDPGLKILELIMTAPMIVTNWINMQYYASTIDPVKFGTGNKTINNVVGTIGCIQGNAGDLLAGLGEQSVRYNDKYFHEPVRLQVFIEAPTESIDAIVQKHELVSDLVENGWVHIIAIDPVSEQLRLRNSNSWIDLQEGLWN